MSTEKQKFTYQPKSFWLEDGDFSERHITVHETIKVPIDTGLFDMFGHALVRVPECVPFGFRGKAPSA